MAPVLTHLTVPLDLYPLLFPGKDMEEEVTAYCVWMAIMAGISFVAMFTQKYFFNRSSELVTYHMRYSLYDSILSKNIGWFDLRENGVGILSASMASDTSLINGVGSESLGPAVESMFAMLVGCVIGFIYCW